MRQTERKTVQALRKVVKEKVHDPTLAELKVAMRAACYAGAYFRSRIESDRTIKMKSSPSDLVTEVDPFCENLISETIHRAFQEDFILGEESVEPGAKAAASAISRVEEFERLWIVDPLDGTNNYISKIPLSVVSIAFVQKGVLRAGVVYDPFRDEVFFAVHGLGAYVLKSSRALTFALDEKVGVPLPGNRIHVSTCEGLDSSVVATGFPARGKDRNWATGKALMVAKKARSFRALGAAALELAYVAAGRIDLFWEYELNAWDIAAGMLLIQEAGGVIHSLNHKNGLFMRNILACGTTKIASEFRTVLDNNFI